MLESSVLLAVAAIEPTVARLLVEPARRRMTRNTARASTTTAIPATMPATTGVETPLEEDADWSDGGGAPEEAEPRGRHDAASVVLKPAALSTRPKAHKLRKSYTASGSEKPTCMIVLPGKKVVTL